jgi:cytochrome P450
MTGSLTYAEQKYGCDIDLFSEVSLNDPFDNYRSFRDMGRVAYMRAHKVWIITRYDEVKGVLADPKTFSSAEGPVINNVLNKAWKGMAVASDGKDHAHLRQVMMQVLGPRSSQTWAEDIKRTAKTIVDDLLEHREFDAVVDFAQMMPMLSVLHVLGLSPDIETRRDLLHWATDAYDACGPDGTYREDHLTRSIPNLYTYASENITRGKVRPDSVGDLTFRAVDAGQITEEMAAGIIGSYITAGLDTTASGIGNMMLLLCQHPEQWKILRDDPSLINSAFLEAVRMETPIQWFARVTTRDVEFDDVVIPAGTRLVHYYGSANRDERHYVEPNRFDVRRNPVDSMAFGFGVHSCVGRWLSDLEVQSLMKEFVTRVDRLELLGEPVRHMNNTIRSLERLPVRVHVR